MKLWFIEGLIDEDKVFKKAFKSQNFWYKLLTTKLEKTWLERFELTKKMLVK